MSHKLRGIDPTTLVGNPRATLTAWIRYESIVVAAFRQHPSPYRYIPANVSPATVASRIRDAIRGKLAFDYPCVIPNATLLAWYAEIIVKYDSTQVYIGLPLANTTALEGQCIPQSPLTSSTKTNEANPSSSSHIFDSLTLEELIAFTVLLDTGRILGPVLIHHPPDISLLPDRSNVEILSRPDGALILM